jgi:hypothetical protein
MKYVTSLWPDPKQSREHVTSTLKVAVVGWVTDATEASVNAKVNV